jgi:hypothetical protein
MDYTAWINGRLVMRGVSYNVALVLAKRGAEGLARHRGRAIPWEVRAADGSVAATGTATVEVG